MAVALVQEFKIVGSDRTTANCDQIAQRLGIDSNPPKGLIAHTAGWDEQAGVFRIVAIWRSADEAQSFTQDRLRPILDERPVDPARGEQPDLESMYELYHCVRARIAHALAAEPRVCARAASGDGANNDEEGWPLIARIATFEVGDAQEMRRRNNEMLVERAATALPPGILRVMVLTKDESRWAVISFFDSEEAAVAAEERFEQMGDQIPESVRGKRISLETFEVAFDVEMIR